MKPGIGNGKKSVHEENPSRRMHQVRQCTQGGRGGDMITYLSIMAPDHGVGRLGRVLNQASEIDRAALVYEQVRSTGNLGNRL